MAETPKTPTPRRPVARRKPVPPGTKVEKLGTAKPAKPASKPARAPASPAGGVSLVELRGLLAEVEGAVARMLATQVRLKAAIRRAERRTAH